MRRSFQVRALTAIAGLTAGVSLAACSSGGGGGGPNNATQGAGGAGGKGIVVLRYKFQS